MPSDSTTPKRRTGIVRDRRFLEHRTGVHHVETPQRLEAVYSSLYRSDLQASLIDIAPRLASLEEVEMVHTPDYVEKILDTAREPLRYLDPDTVTSERSCETAFLAAGGIIEAVRSVSSGDCDNAFALVRPPGHHAEHNRQMGFCLFNNVALAAEYARRRLGITRILIVDWDVHHGNGTQHIFEAVPEVLFFSSHRFPFFPGTGAADEVGLKDGRGFTINAPLPAGQQDAAYAEVFRRILVPAALEFQPHLILVSAGFDAHQDDPIGGMQLTKKGFAYLTKTICDIAEQTCEGKVVMMLEGGYDLGALRTSIKSVLEVLQQGLPEQTCRQLERPPGNSSEINDIIAQIAKNQKPFWKCFR